MTQPSGAATDLVDEGSFTPQEDGLRSTDPLRYPDYERTLDAARTRALTDESVVYGSARLDGHDVEFATFVFSFIGGSMGEVAGERLARSMERAAQRGVPFVLYTATGGARMHEGMRSLVQMPRTVAARHSLAEAGQPFIAALGNPTTGGVLASVGALADVTVAEAGATIGFAGPRLVQRHTGRALAPGSHRAESALAGGLVDAVVRRDDLRGRLGAILAVLAADEPAPTEEQAGPPPDPPPSDPLDAVAAARDERRPTAPLLAWEMADRHLELRGDRRGHDDPGIRAAIARIAGRRAVTLALDRERPPGPHAYDKARRALALASRLRLPVVTLVDTEGADPSEPSEAGGIAWSIAQLFEDMLSAPVPIVSIVTGQGGSGGALALAVGDVLLAYRDSIFTVVAPESAAEILWRDPARASDAARLLRPTAQDLERLGIADGIIDAPLDARSLRAVVAYHLDRLRKETLSAQDLIARRHKRWWRGE